MRNQDSALALGRERPAVVVIGGGLAGIATSVTLARANVPVTLIETRKRLGGRATSFVDPATGQILDNCQHVLMGCCTNLCDLYEKLGVSKHIRWYKRLNFAGTDRTGRIVIDRLEAGGLPPPLHLAASLLCFRSLTLREKFAIARGMLAMICLGEDRHAALHRISFQEWLGSIRQPQSAVDKFWSVVIVSALNERPDKVAADLAIQVFQEGFLAHEDAYVMGLPTIPLMDLYDAAERVIKGAGGQVCLATSAQTLGFADGRVTAVQVAGGRCLEADAFVSTVPFDRLEKLCSSVMFDADIRLQGLMDFQVSPILGIHLWFQHAHNLPVMRLPHLVLTHGPLQWIFNKGMQWLPPRGATSKTLDDCHELNNQDPIVSHQHLHGVISAAHDMVDWPAERITAMAVAEVTKVIPEVAEARLVDARVIKEKRATFSAIPGSQVLRPAARGDIANLYLAGDWCRSGWPATMEGAVRSGYKAAAALLQDAHQKVDVPVPDLAARLVFRLLSRRKLSRDTSV